MYEAAVKEFDVALKLLNGQPAVSRAAWEPTMFNLAHAWRKISAKSDTLEPYVDPTETCAIMMSL